MYSTDNGPHMNSWPDGGMTPFRSEKNTNWEGAFRVPDGGALAGQDQAGSGLERDRPAPRLAPDLPRHGRRSGRRREAEERLSGDRPHLQTTSTATIFCPTSPARQKESPRKFFMYLSDDGDVLGLRYDNWKMVFMEQRCHGTLQIWAEPFTRLRVAKLFNLRTDPYERADQTSNTYYEWFIRPRLHVVRSASGRRPMGRDLQGLSRQFRSPTPSPSTTR